MAIDDEFCATEALPFDTVLALQYGKKNDRPLTLEELRKQTDMWHRYQDYCLRACESGGEVVTFGQWKTIVNENEKEST
jgi:hypothetical protein